MVIGNPSGMTAVLSSVRRSTGCTSIQQLRLTLVIGAEGVLDALQAHIEEFLDLGELLRVGLGDRQRRTPQFTPRLSNALANAFS